MADHAEGLERVVAAMQTSALRPVWEELASRWSVAGPNPVRSIALGSLDLAARTAVADLLGLDRVPPSSTRLKVRRLTESLAVDEHGLRAAVELVVGPVTDVAGARAAEAAAREELWAWLSQECDRRGLQSWFSQVRAGGVRGGDPGSFRRDLSAVLDLIDHLPADGVALAVLAAHHFGDPHALDRGRRLGTLTIRALAAVDGDARSDSPEDVRRLWSAFGVVADGLSSNVLVLGLRTSPANALHEYLDRAAGTSEPVVLTLDQVRRHGVEPLAPCTVRVVENPPIVAEAAARRVDGVYVCSSGWPSVAVTSLLGALAEAGCRLLVHADFDADGIGIVNHLQRLTGATPWMMSSQVYLAALIEAVDTIPESTTVPPTSWDPALGTAMTTHRSVVYEEQLLDQLLSPG